MWIKLVVISSLVCCLSARSSFAKKNSKLSLILVEKDEEISELTSKLNEFKLIARILTDQVTFLKGSINYYKKMALDERKDKENIRRTLLAQLEGLETKYQSRVEEAKDEVRQENEGKLRALKTQFTAEKKQLIENMESTHRKEIAEIKRGLQTKVDKADTEQRNLTDLKAKLKDDKKKVVRNEEDPKGLKSRVC